MSAVSMSRDLSSSVSPYFQWSGARSLRAVHSSRSSTGPNYWKSLRKTFLPHALGPGFDLLVGLASTTTEDDEQFSGIVNQFSGGDLEPWQAWPTSRAVCHTVRARVLAATSDDSSDSAIEVDECLKLLAVLEKDQHPRKAGKWLMGIIEVSLAKDDLQRVDMILRRADPELMSSWSVNALLRSTYRARKFLPAWGAALQQAKVKLARREDAKGLFVGLE